MKLFAQRLDERSDRNNNATLSFSGSVAFNLRLQEDVERTIEAGGVRER